MAKNYFKSYIWLLETLQARGRMTLKEIKDAWLRSSVNDEGKDLANRTFANHVAAIADIFGIDIVCDRRDNTYYIENDEELGGRGIQAWMLNALSLNALLNESAGLRNQIFFENVPSSQEHLTTIIQAIREKRMLEITYQSFDQTEPFDSVVEPYFLQQYRRRWYLFARDNNHKYEGPHVFALDRMSSAALSKKPFKLPKSFDPQAFISLRYGISRGKDDEPEHITLKVTAGQANYLRTLPLHDSQQEIERTKDYSIFTYYLVPNYEFIHDILSFGETVEVLEPAKVRDEIIEEINKLKLAYDSHYQKRG